MDEIIYVPFSEDDDYNEQLEDLGIDTEIALEDAESIVRHSRLGISRENKLSGVLVDTTKKEVVGTLWINSQAINDHEFNFDVAIHPNYRGRGLAEVLIKAMIEEYKEYNSMYEEMHGKRLPIMITVINPLLINLLKRYGFRIDKQGSDRVYMTHDTLRENKLNKIINEEVRNQFILKERNVGRRKQLQTITENTLQGKTLISVDIQPEYENWITFDLGDWVEFINANAENNRIVFLYNGADTLGMVSEGEYINWLFELGIEEEVINHAIFYDKGYAFFRTCMDSNIDMDNIVDLVQYMINNNITDSRDIDEDMWNDYMQTTQHDQEEVRELLENAGDMISVPDLMDFLKNYSNIVVFGGGINECLKEVEIALLALNKNYDILNQYTY